MAMQVGRKVSRLGSRGFYLPVSNLQLSASTFITTDITYFEVYAVSLARRYALGLRVRRKEMSTLRSHCILSLLCYRP